MAAPEVGQIEEGYRFKGGDPADPASWEQVSAPEAAGFTDLGGGFFRDPSGGVFQQNRQGQLVRRTGTAGGDVSAQRMARNDFEGLQPVRDFRDTQAAFDSIRTAANDDSGASDMAMVFALNKLLDPGSVVREGEYDRSLDQGGVSARLQGYMTKLQNGEFLTPAVRAQLVNTAQSLYEVRRDQYNNLANRYQDLAREDGLNPIAVAREEFRGQRIANDPGAQEEGQANRAQVEAVGRLQGYNRQAPIGTPQHPYVISPGVSLENLPPESAYIDTDGTVRVVGREGAVGQDESGLYTSTGDQPLAPTDTPNNLSAQGYVYDGGSDTWVRRRSPEDMGWTPESAVAQRREIDDTPLGNVGRHIDGFIRGVADQPTAEFADEIAGGMDAIAGRGVGGSVRERWANNNRVQRAVDAADGRDMPFTRRAGEVVGAAAAVPLAMLAGGPGGPGLWRNALGGAIAGGTAGAGNAEGGAADRIIPATGGALAGAAVGALAQPVVNAISPMVSAGAQSARRFGRRVIGRALNALGSPAGGRMVADASPNALQSAVSKFAERGGVSPNALQPAAQGFRDSGIEPVLFDVAGDGGQAVGRALTSRNPTARQGVVDFARRRRVGAQDRVSEIARRNVSSEPRLASQVADDLERQQADLSAAQMGPLRDRPVTLTPEVATVFRTPGGRAAIEQARAWTANSQQSDELAALARLAEDAIDRPGQIQLSLGTIDRLRRSLGNQARAARDGDSRQGLTQLQRQLRGNAVHPEFGVPEYGTFLTDYADRAQLDDALEAGRGFLTRRGTGDFAREAGSMNEAQNTVARVAARDMMEERGSTPSGAASLLDELSVGRGQGQRSDGLLREGADRLRTEADFARRELETGRNISPRTGSPTNDNSQNSAMANGVAEGIGIARDVATGNKFGLAARAADFIRSRGFSDQEAQALLEAAIDPSRTDELIEMIATRVGTRREARNAARFISHALSRQSGSATGQTLSSQ